MNDFQYKLARFFQGRRGTDQLNLFLMIFSFAIQIIGRVFGSWILMILGQVALVWMIFRMLSKNIYSREKENQVFLSVWNKFSRKGRGNKSHRNNYNGGSYNNDSQYNSSSAYSQSQYYKEAYSEPKSKKKPNNPKSSIQYCYYHCPECKQQIRIPVGKGKVRVTCPSCKNKFEIRT